MKQPLDPRSVPYGTVEGWLWHLGLLCAGSMPSDEAAMRIAEFAEMLADRRGTGAFCRESCAFVAAQCAFFPSFAEVVKHLATWQRDRFDALPKPLTPVDRAVAATRNRIALEHLAVPRLWDRLRRLPEPHEIAAEVEKLRDERAAP